MDINKVDKMVISPVNVSPEKVKQIMEMGFTYIQACEALQSYNINDIYCFTV